MCSKSAIFLENNTSNKERSGLQYTWNEKKNLCSTFLLRNQWSLTIFLIRNVAIGQNKIKLKHRKR